jgi:hypothetical protein
MKNMIRMNLLRLFIIGSTKSLTGCIMMLNRSRKYSEIVSTRKDVNWFLDVCSLPRKTKAQLDAGIFELSHLKGCSSFLGFPHARLDAGVVIIVLIAAKRPIFLYTQLTHNFDSAQSAVQA